LNINPTSTSNKNQATQTIRVVGSDGVVTSASNGSINITTSIKEHTSDKPSSANSRFKYLTNDGGLDAVIGSVTQDGKVVDGLTDYHEFATWRNTYM
jgi:hypothetical protein